MGGDFRSGKRAFSGKTTNDSVVPVKLLLRILLVPYGKCNFYWNLRMNPSLIRAPDQVSVCRSQQRTCLTLSLPTTYSQRPRSPLLLFLPLLLLLLSLLLLLFLFPRLPALLPLPLLSCLSPLLPSPDTLTPPHSLRPEGHLKCFNNKVRY